MPRQSRVHVPGGVYHAVLRGNHRQAIFDLRDDYLRFEEILAAALDRYGATLFAYCWMTNHVHLAIRIAEAPLGAVMRIVASRYARWRQRTVPTTGHLFERRYRARLVDADRYLLALVRYIHLNPVRAGIVADPAAYPWSSHHAYLGEPCPHWVSIRPALALLGSPGDEACTVYRRFMGEEPAESERDALSVATRPAASRRAASPAALRMPRANPAGLAPPSLPAIAAEVAREHGLTVGEMLARRRRPDLVLARVEMTRRALRAGAATLSQVARYLNRSPSTLSDLLRHRRHGGLPKP